MTEINAFLKRPLFTVDGFRLTIGAALIVVLLVYWFYVKKGKLK
jgi:hypothetical protein